MADINDIQAAQAVKLVGSDNTGVEQTPVQSTTNGAVHSNLRDNSGVEIGTTANPLKVNSVVIPVFDSSTAALGAGASYTTPSFDSLTGATFLSYSAFSSTGLSVTFQESSDNTNWTPLDSYTVGIGGSNYSAHKLSGRYGRVVYTNTGSANPGGVANLNLLTSLSPSASETDVSIVDNFGNPISSVIGGTGNYNLSVAQSATNYALSTSNTTTAQLTAGATFTGAIENTFNQQSISILLTCDQTGTLTINQYIDLAGTRKVTPIVYTIPANVQFSRSFPINGNYVNIVFTNNGAVTTTTLNINTAYGTIPSASSRGNSPISIDEVNGTVFNLQNGALPVTISNTLLSSYSAQASAIIPVAAAQDIFWITGSATKTVRVTKIGISATQTTLSTVPTFLIKRSTANSGGTPTTQTNVPNDSSFAAATVSVISNTGSVTTGTPVGTIKSIKMKVGTTTSSYATDQLIYVFDQPITLRGTAQLLAVNLGAATVTGGSYNIWIEWTEE